MHERIFYSHKNRKNHLREQFSCCLHSLTVNLNYDYLHKVAHEINRSASGVEWPMLISPRGFVRCLFETESYEVENYNFVNQEESLRDKQEALGRRWTG